MDRSLAARSTRPFGAGSATRRARRAGRRRPRLGALVPRGARARIALVCVLIAVPLLGGGWMLLRNSPLVSVSHVRVTGVSGPQAGAIEGALDSAARHMSTLNVNVGALRAAVAPFHLVRALHVSTSFPHTLHIAVEEELPVAALQVEGTRTAVSADGVVLGPALLRGSLPVVQTSSAPPVGARVGNYYARVALIVIGAAPPALARLITRAYAAPQGVAVALRGGLVAYFGDGTRPHAKWLSLARVLADPSSSGASYVDVRLPERPAAGFSASTTEQTATSAAPLTAKERSAPRESSIQALAEGLGAPSGNAAANAAAAAAGTSTSTTGASETTEHEATSTAREGGSEGHENEGASREKEASTSTGG